MGLSGISTPFEVLSRIIRQIIYALLTRAPLNEEQAPHSVRLACVRHAASVRSEPGSNSPVYTDKFVTRKLLLTILYYNHLSLLFGFQRPAVQPDGQHTQIKPPCQPLFSDTNSFFRAPLKDNSSASKGTRFLTQQIS